MKVIKSPSGAPLTVHEDHVDKFQGLINDLETAGYPIKPDQSGGYTPRNIAGTETPSHHANGSAVDINWTDNPRGGKAAIDPQLARDLAAKHGLTWGGDWKSPDPMHFEVSGAKPTAADAAGMSDAAPNLPAGGVSEGEAPIAAPAPRAASGGLLGPLMDQLGLPAQQQQAEAPSADDLLEKLGLKVPESQKDFLEPVQIQMPKVKMGNPQARMALGRAAMMRGRG